MTLLSLNRLEAGYGDFQALFGVTLDIAEGTTTGIIGANGAGKSTLMRAICGMLPRRPGMVRLEGADLAARSPGEIARAGIRMVPEGRRLFASLSVEENLAIGAQAARPGPWTLGRVFDLFPILQEFRARPATALSGGQQQMVAIGRALLGNPKLLLCDELSLGLAPVVIRDIYAALPAIRTDGTAVVVVEQDIGKALEVSDRVHCMMEGRITLSGPPATLSRDAIHAAYFGAAPKEGAA